jgi:uncharacterized phage protein (predicted DNA packaging)
LELEELKLFMKIDGTDEDTLITSLQAAAEEYMKNAGVIKDYTKFLYALAIKMLVGHWYENRSVVGKADKLAFSLDSMIIQLKYTQVEPVVVVV